MITDPEIARFLFEHARDILLVIDADSGQIIDANLAAEHAYGYGREALLGLTIFQLRAADLEPVPAQMRRANTEGLLFRALHQRRDGTTFPVEVNSTGETIRGRRILLSVIRDITEQRRQEIERDALIENTQRALRMREEFLAIVAHELRSPVTNMSMKFDQFVRQVDRTSADPALASAARDALGEVARLSTLITRLLDAQQLAGQIVLARGVVDLSEVVTEVVARVRGRAESLGSAVLVEVPSVFGEWDRLCLEQVFTNLLVNALKFGRGRPIEVSATVDEPNVRVEVKDQGIGIAAADAPRIFEKFQRAVPPAYGGLGLGLYITRQLVEAHGGSISFESAPGEGTTFRVKLPRAAR